jgi:diguanylate cyclase (GGDEF)-like protein
MMKVLIVDDSEDSLAIAKARLAGEGVQIITAPDGPGALATARAQRPDLVLLDIDMPGMSGFEVLRRLKADTELCMIPVIFLSGSGGPEAKVQGLDLGATDYVTKPFDAFELRARVRAALRTKRLQDLLLEYARLDPLTALANRRAMEERLAQEWSRLARHGGRLSFLMADIDHFKAVNDRFGHPVGDLVLQDVARAMASHCRQTDLPARYGGEEFALIVPDVPADGAATLAERIRQTVEANSRLAGAAEVRVTVSIGVADSQGRHSPEELVSAADKALYEAKNAGRNRVVSA